MLDFIKADAQTRTADLLITNQLLYHLSYTGKTLIQAITTTESWIPDIVHAVISSRHMVLKTESSLIVFP